MEQKQNTAKYVFLYLLSLVGLVFTAISLGTIVFQIINKFIVDVASNYSGSFSDDAIKFSVSAIIVAAPIFYVSTNLLYKSLVKGELSKDSGLRRWLTYFILFVSAMIVLGWMIATVNNFFQGEITLKFALKALTVLGIASSIFAFYLYDIRRQEVVAQADKIIKRFAIGSMAVLLVVFVAAFLVMESPRETRDKRLDQALLNAFSQIDICVESYYNKYQILPENLEVLKSDCRYWLDDSLVDAETKRAIEYKIVADKNYALCADFRTSNNDSQTNNYYDRPESRKSHLHDAGWQCLEREVVIFNLEKEQPAPPDGRVQ